MYAQTDLAVQSVSPAGPATSVDLAMAPWTAASLLYLSFLLVSSRKGDNLQTATNLNPGAAAPYDDVLQHKIFWNSYSFTSMFVDFG